MRTRKRLTASVELAKAPRKHKLNHPYYRGFPNNQELQRLAKEAK